MTNRWKAVEQYFTVELFVNPLTPRVKPWVIQSFLTFDSMDKPKVKPFVGKLLSSKYFTVVLFAFQVYPVCNFGKFISYFALGTVRTERVNLHT